jgi:hypothetical protein
VLSTKPSAQRRSDQHQRMYMNATEKEKHQLEDTISNFKHKLEMVQIINISRDREAIINSEEYELERKQLKELKEEYDLYKEHVFQNLPEVVNQNFLLMKVVYSLKEEIKENNLKMKDLEATNNSNNHTLNEKGVLINFQSASLENVETNNIELKGLLEKKDNEINEKDAIIESPTNMKSFESYNYNIVGVSEQSKTINSPDFDIGHFMDEVRRKPENNCLNPNSTNSSV